jgi:hypothetical protein
MKQNPLLVLVLALVFPPIAFVQSRAADGPTDAPQAVPGKGLAQPDFLYAGESKNRRAFIVRKGEVVWSYDDPEGRGEINDALPIGSEHVLYVQNGDPALVKVVNLTTGETKNGSPCRSAIPRASAGISGTRGSRFGDEADAPERVAFSEFK